ncbi:MAG: hypothetical protein HY762_05360 [Planctomycetes bacterium]|nr:hypothetical protein [Planctomycetota bacterium]
MRLPYPFDYGVQVKVFIQNLSDQPQTRDLKVELDWKARTYFKTRTITLSPRSSDTFAVDFYEPTAGEEYYTYKVLVR